MRYKVKIIEKKTPDCNCTQLNSWIIRKFFKYSKEYYITHNSSPSPYLYSYMKLQKQLEKFHYAKNLNKNT